ncbi:unnamed protein product [Menidia menidia]|uniref:(Atlantic silverside) hypothetical protein n=1 Tax=Menidia menidia TaxID=238744 RepID=A0A8S4AWD4_9TELE|nr:unnamed protein product [Menidia menidia]
MIQVQEAVHGVTLEECQAALQNHNWNVQKAVQYLKVEQLFCLGLRSRAECAKLLEMCDWNLEKASTHMLDNYGSTARQRYLKCSLSSKRSPGGDGKSGAAELRLELHPQRDAIRARTFPLALQSE